MRRARYEDPFEGAGGDGLAVFVPAIMSVGLVFSVVTLIKDLLRRSGGRAQRRRTRAHAESTVGLLLGSESPQPSPWAVRVLHRTVPRRRGPAGPPSSVVSKALAVAAVAMAVLTFVVGTGQGVMMEIDRPLATRLVETEWMGRLDFLDLFGNTLVSVAFVTAIGFAGFRCRVMALIYPAAFVFSWIATEVLQHTIERARPIEAIGGAQSFPSGHMVQAVFIAGLFPLAVEVLIGDRRVTLVARLALGALVVLTGLNRVHGSTHWPLDVIAGAILGLCVVLAAHWAIGHAAWHQRCSACAWSGRAVHPEWQRAVFAFRPRTARMLRLAGAGAGLVVAVALLAGTVFVGLPQDPEGYGFSSDVSGPVQISLAVLVGLSSLAAVRWPLAAASSVAFSAVALGVFASIQYAPVLTVLLAAMAMTPAVVMWLSWQTEQTLGAIAAVALVASTLLGSVGVGSSLVADHFFGPSHPQSMITAPEPLEAEWLWLGGVTSTEATIVAGGLAPGALYTARLTDPHGVVYVVDGVADQFGIARFTASDLVASTPYGYVVLDAAGPSSAVPPDSTFKTMPVDSDGLVVVFGACARVGTNGAVFEQMALEEPDLFVATGDLHYANLASTDPSDHLAAYGRLLEEPAPALLLRSVPTAYVWDDHDYGPNDADASSPSRAAVGVAYRAAVPHYGVSETAGEAISQAFSIADVRFVLTDTRSQRTSETMLGPAQRDWLTSEIVSAAATHRLVVWVNPTPWISSEASSGDDWASFAAERELINKRLAEAEVDNLVMVSGDAHMVAIDDGTNSGYAEGWGFPVLHGAALDRPGRVKGGPYSEGAVPGGGQYGQLEISQLDEHTTEVTLSGRRWDGVVLLSYTFTLD